MTGNWKTWLIGMTASLVIFGVVYFTVIQPSSNTANQAIRSSERQAQQVINQAQKQLTTSGVQAPTGSSSGVSTQAQQQINSAAKLASCVTAAGTNTGAIQACQAKYKP